MKYTKKDVIIWIDDERLKNATGQECYKGDTVYEALENANHDRETYKYLGYEASNTPFCVASNYNCNDLYSPVIILKKKTFKETKIIPFDFSLKEDRDALIGKRIYSESENDDRIIIKKRFKDVPFDLSFPEDRDVLRDKWVTQLGTGIEMKINLFKPESGWTANGYSAEELFKNFVYLGSCKPVGKEVEK